MSNEKKKLNKQKINEFNYDGKLLLAKLHDAATTKLIFEALKDLVNKCPIVFKKPKVIDGEINEDSGGLFISFFDRSTSTYYKIRIFYKAFSPFYLNPDDGSDEIRFPLDPKLLTQRLKNVGKNPIQLEINTAQKDFLILNFNDIDRNISKKCELRKLDFNFDNYLINTVEPECEMIIDSNDYIRTIKDMASCNSIIEIEYQDTKKIQPNLNLSSTGFWGENVSHKFDKDTKDFRIVKKSDSEDIIFKGKYKASSLLTFQKCINSCSSVRMYIKRGSPIIIKYEIANFGYILSIISSADDSDDLADTENNVQNKTYEDLKTNDEDLSDSDDEELDDDQEDEDEDEDEELDDED